jgi:hypothetical protein
MELGFADEIGVKDGERYAVIWMTVDSVEDAKSCHSSIRSLPLVRFDRTVFVEYPNRDYRIHGRAYVRSDKKAKWYKIEGEPEHV